jgi:cell division septum initiation protein DivIVA
VEIMHLLDRLETVLTSSSRIPITGKAVVDEQECLDIIDQMRVAIPDEVKQAKRLQQDRDRIIQDAEEEAARAVAHAQDQASSMVLQQEITRAAEAKARRLMEEADREAKERREEADRYAAQTLAELDRRLAEIQMVVRNGIRALSRASDRDQPADDA